MTTTAYNYAVELVSIHCDGSTLTKWRQGVAGWHIGPLLRIVEFVYGEYSDGIFCVKAYHFFGELYPKLRFGEGFSLRAGDLPPINLTISCNLDSRRGVYLNNDVFHTPASLGHHAVRASAHGELAGMKGILIFLIMHTFRSDIWYQ